MGAKFRISPRIDAQLSQRTEGKIRDKTITKAQTKDQKLDRARRAIPENTKIPEVSEEIETENKDGEPTGTRRSTSRLVPYVDLAPRKVTKVTEPVNQSQSKEEPRYKNRAPVEVGLDIEGLVDSVMEMEVTVPLKSLAGVSGAIQKEIRKQMTKARILDDPSPDKEEPIKARPKIHLQDVEVESVVVEADFSSEVFAGCIVGGDPILQLVAQNTNAGINRVEVGKMTEPLRAIYTTINGVGQEECLLDGGSMIVSMSKRIAVQLGLVWDPTVRMDMESASNHVEQTLGVARNVSFEVGGLKLFLQVHVLENPPYKVLLGKPFETLGATVIQTYEDGSAEVVIKDPNTKRVAVVPTYKRGETPEGLQKTKQQGF